MQKRFDISGLATSNQPIDLRDHDARIAYASKSLDLRNRRPSNPQFHTQELDFYEMMPGYAELPQAWEGPDWSAIRSSITTPIMDTFAAVWRVAKRFWALTALIILMVVYAILFLFYITRPLIGIHPVSVHSPSRTTSTNTQTSNKGSSVSPVQTGSSSSGATQGSSASNVTTGGTTPTPGMGSGTNSGVNSSVSSNGSSATVCLGPTCVDPSLPNLSSPAPLPTN